MSVPRADFAGALLQNGKVLLIGGQTSATSDTAHVDLYDPVTNGVTGAAPMASPRNGHTATLLPNGKVLVAGGARTPTGPALASAELYDPSTNTWRAAPAMAQGRSHHAAILLSNGKVFVAGGDGGADPASELPDPTANEIYDSASNTWTAARTFYGDRPHGPAVIQLRDGRVLVIGATAEPQLGNAVEFYDPSTGQSINGVVLPPAWTNFSTSSELGDGTVVIVGGQVNNNPAGALNTTWIYDPSQDYSGCTKCAAWTAGPAMDVGRCHHTMTALRNGLIIVAGGRCGRSDSIAVAEIFEPVGKTWQPAGSLQDPRGLHVAVLLADGRIFVAGGFLPGASIGATTELYTPA